MTREERQKKEAERIAKLTGRQTFVVQIGEDPEYVIYTASLEPGDGRPIYTAAAPAVYGRRGPNGKISKKIIEFLAKVGTSSPVGIRKTLGLSEKQVANALAKNLETFERAAPGVWQLRTPGVKPLSVPKHKNESMAA